MRWKDVKRRAKNLLSEFKDEKIGIVGVGILVSVLMLGLAAPLIANNVNSDWGRVDRWRDYPDGAAPAWINYFSRKSRAPQLEEHDYNISVYPTRTEVQFTYDYPYDTPPRNIILYLEGEFEGPRPRVYVDLLRPDGEDIDRLKATEIDGREENGKYQFSRRLILIRRGEQRERIYRWADSFEEESVDFGDMRVEETAFGKAQGNILSDPEPLQGEYTLRLRITGDEVNIQNSSAIFMGQVYGLMGTDDSGRDIALGWFWGARYGLILGVVVAVLTVIIALSYGMTSAYYGGWVDETMQRINEIVMGLPVFPIMVLIMMLWGRSYWYVIMLLAALYWRGIAKNIRARGLQIRQNTYVEASESLGASGSRIVRTHMIPQMLPYALAEGALMVPLAIITAAGLNLLGLGDPSIVTWGTMLNQAHTAGATIRGMWWWVLLPGLGIILLGFGFISSGMAIERIVNPKMKQG